MALIKCKECGKEISDQAPTCPGCGAPRHIAQGLPETWARQDPIPANQSPQQPKPTPQPIAPPPRKRNSGCAILVVIFIGLIAFSSIVSRCSSTNEPATTSTDSPSPAVKTGGIEKKSASVLMSQMQDERLDAANRLGIAHALTRNYPGTPEAIKAIELIPALQQQIASQPKASPELGAQWRYDRSEDAMTSKPVLSASVMSTNSFEFEFPYQGSQNATLTLRKHPRWGGDVFLSIEKGQILCSTYECPIRVRFDDSAPQTLSGNEPSDNSSEYVFIPGYANFSKRLQKAKRVRIEVNVFQQGTLVADFDVEGFKPEQLSK